MEFLIGALVLLIVLSGVIALVVAAVALSRAGAAREEAQQLTERLTELELEVYRLRSLRSRPPETAPEEKRTTATEQPPQSPQAAVAPAVEKPAVPPVPVIPVVPSVETNISAPPTPPPVIVPPSVPAAQEKAAAVPPLFIRKAEPAPMPEPSEAPEPPPLPEKESIEMRVGSYWAVRVGIVIILTGLAFAANLAYHNIVPKLGPGGKIALLYLASGLLLGAGAWWQRRNVKESLKNYAQVLFAGGLAAVYFTTYAAHHIPPLRVVENAVVDGALLLGWAGVIAWIADRRKSEVMALFAVGLAFYSSIITRVGDFTLYSNLVLTIAAVVFLIRNRWVSLSFAGLATSYAGYAFWRFLHEDGWRWAGPDERLGFGASFLAGYWLVFTVATFWSRHEKLSGKSRAAFLTLNNGAFFALFLLTMIQVQTGGLWKFCLGYGTTLLALTALAKKMLPEEPLTRNTYLTQGLLLVTLGFISKFAGLKLALVLGVESVVLYLLAQQRGSAVLKFFAYAAALLGMAWNVANQKPFDAHGLWVGVTLGALMMVNAFFAHRQAGERPDEPLRAEPTVFTLLAFASWLAATWFNTTRANFPLALAAETVALTFSIYLLRMREVSLLGQFFLIIAQLAWLFHFLNTTPPWWNPVLLIAVTLGLSHWWQHQKNIAISKNIFVCYSTIFALASIAIVIAWLHPQVQASTWLALTSLLALAATLYGIFTRAWPLAVCGQIFLASSAWEYLVELLHGKPEWYYPLAPLAALGTLSFGTVAWFARKPDADANVRGPLLQVALFYRWTAQVMSLLWIWQYVPERQRVGAYMLAAVTVFAVALWRRNREALIAVAVYAAVSLMVLWAGEDFLKMDAYWANLLSLLALLVMQQILRRQSARLPLDEKIHAATVIIAGLSLWRLLSCWVTISGIFLTMSWAGFAVVFFGLGIFLRERFYRWFGLGVLAAAVGRVVIVDVWRQETIYRVLTFMALGVALLVVGFIYNKYQETIRKWL